MADEETQLDEPVEVFDATKKKKKKKPKEGGEEAGAEDAAGEITEKVADLKVSDGDEGGVALDFGKKKKKKKPKEGEGEGDGETQAAGDEAPAEGEGVGEDEGGALPLMKKKKKKKQRAADDELPEESQAPVEKDKDKEKEKEAKEEGAEGEEKEAAKEEEEEEDGDVPEGDDDGDDAFDEEAGEIELGGPAKLPWEGTDRDYLYEELLGRVFDILRQKNPELAGDRRRTIMRPPQVLREGTKKTVFANFMDLCKIMHRQPEHVMAFLLAELGTSGSLDGQQRLVVKGRFAPKNFEGLLRRYVTEYVMCNGCKSPDTILSKENRLYFVRCEQCGSHRSVQQIKAGFQARVKKRERTG